MSQKSTLKAKGLYTEPNQLSELPEGSMLVAENVVIDRSNVVESRRGFAQYGNTFGLPDQRAKQLLVYKNRILIHNDDNLYFNANPHNTSVDGDFQKFYGSYLETETGLRIRSAESNKNLYFTSSDGIKKISAKTADDFTTTAGFIRDSGAAKALDVTGELHSTPVGFLPPNSKVAYRIVWSYKDINNNLLAGSPSSRLVISNYNNINANVDLEFTIPQSVTTEYFYQVYRSAVFTATGSLTLADIDPGDELQLVIEDFPTAAQLAAGLVTVTDLAPEDFRTGGLPLYTNPNSGDGIQSANEPPPKAKDIAMYQSTLFYGNTETRANTTITLLTVEDLISGTSSITINDSVNPAQTYTFVGTKEKSKFNFGPYTSTIPLLNGKYFLLNSASDKRKYYVWYDNTKTKQIIDFALYVGVVPTELDSKFFVLYTPVSDRTYYVWYDATGSSVDPGTDPTNGLVGFNGIRVNIATGVANVVQLANATQIAIALNDIDDDFDVNYRTGTAAGVTVTAGNPTTFTSAAHGLSTGDRVTVTASTTTPSINGHQYVTVTGPNSFTIPVTTTVGGTATWACDSAAVIVYSKSFDTSSIVQLEVLGKGFSLTAASDTSLDPALDLITNTDVVGRTPIRVNTSRNVSTLALVTDETAASIQETDLASDFNVTYTSGNTYLEVENTNNGVTDDAHDSLIHPIAHSFAITIENQGQGEDAALNQVLLSSAATPGQQIDETARSLVNIINKNASSSVYAFYLSGPTDLPGQILLQVNDIGVNQFTVTANSAATGADFNPSLPPVLNAQPVSGVAEVKPNRIYFAKLQQPEAVPLLNFLDVGPADKAISRILALRTSLFILKEDGVYRLTGTNGNYTVDLFDESTKIIAPDSAVVLNNQIFCLTNLGIVTITDTGVNIISQPIKSTIQLLTSSNYDFKHSTFGVSYENDRSYLLWMPSSVTDTVATIAYRYNTITQTFTTFDMAKTCGIVNVGDDKMYLGPSDINFIERERKLFNRTDFADRNFDLIVPSNSVNDTLLRLSSSVLIDVGDAIVQSQYMTIGEYNQLLKKLDLDPSIGEAEVTKVDFTSFAGSIPSLHSKYFTLFAASNARRYAVFYDAIGDLPSLDTNVFNDLTGAIQIRVDTSSGVTTLADLTEVTKIAIQSASFDFLISHVFGDTFFQTTTIRNGNTDDASDGPGNPIGNGFALTVLQQGLGDYFLSLGMTQGANIYSALSALATKLDSDPGVDQSDFLAAIGTPITFAEAQASFNIIVTKLNLDTSVTYQNYPLSAGIKDLEVLIISKNLNTTDVNMQFSMPYVEGPITVYKGIPCNVQYAAEAFGDTSMLKQVTEATVIFQDANFSRATAGFRTDLSPGYENIDFTKSGKGDFGFFVFSQHNWGGGFSGVPLRTYIPRQKQRCRYMQMTFIHNSSREHFALFGFSYTYRGISERAYRS